MARILFVNLEGKIGGAETSLLLMVKHLDNQFRMSAACPRESPLSRALVSLGIECYKLPSPPKVAYSSLLCLAYWFKTSWHLTRAVSKTKPDLIHANSFYAGAVSVLAALVTRKKLLLHARDLNNFGFLSRFCSWFCERIIAVSHAVKNALVKQGVNQDKIRVVYNGVDSIVFDRSDENGDLFSTLATLEERSFVFAQVGQLVPWKKHTVFLKAASRVAHKLPNARFVLVGDDIFGRDSIYKNSLFSYIESSSIAGKVSFSGWQENMNEVWRKISCLVHTADKEPFGRVIIEAMAHKVPVVAVGACGPSEIIQNGRTGILVQAGDVEGLGNAMLKVAQDTQFTDRLVAAAYRHAISNFTADKTAAGIQDVYREFLAL